MSIHCPLVRVPELQYFPAHPTMSEKQCWHWWCSKKPGETPKEMRHSWANVPWSLVEAVPVDQLVPEHGMSSKWNQHRLQVQWSACEKLQKPPQHSTQTIRTIETYYRNFRWEFMANFDRCHGQTRHQNVSQQTYETSGASHGSTSSSGGWLIDHRPGVQFFPGRPKLLTPFRQPIEHHRFIKKTVVLQVITPFSFPWLSVLNMCKKYTLDDYTIINDQYHNPFQGEM